MEMLAAQPQIEADGSPAELRERPQLNLSIMRIRRYERQ